MNAVFEGRGASIMPWQAPCSPIGMLIIFATRNGASAYLPRMLESLRALHAPSSGVRVLAVDSASDDDTPGLLRASQTDRFEMLSVRKAGKNNALNAALEHVLPGLPDDELIVFTDDDIIAEPDWLLAFERADMKARDADIFGGGIDPVFSVDPDGWLMALADKFNVLFAQSRGEEGECPATSVYGPNMALRARCFKKGVRFDASIGPDGTQTYGMGSETEIFRRLEAAGRRAWYAPDARVGHMIKPSQMSFEAVMRRAWRHGAGSVQMQSVAVGGRTLLGAPVWMRRNQLLAFAGETTSRLLMLEGANALANYELSWLSGAIEEARRQSRSLPSDRRDVAPEYATLPNASRS